MVGWRWANLDHSHRHHNLHAPERGEISTLRTDDYREAPFLLVSAFARRVVCDSRPMRRLADTCTLQLQLRCYTKPSMPKTTEPSERSEQHICYLYLPRIHSRCNVPGASRAGLARLVPDKAILFHDQVWSVRTRFQAPYEEQNSQD